jgi:tetratricopeptide (TPR) repeat protein
MSKLVRRTLTALLIGPAVLATLVSAEGPRHEKPPWQRLLQGADARKAEELDARLRKLQEASRFEEAVQVARELVALREKAQGKDHWEAASARWEEDALQRVLRADKGVQDEYAGVFALDRQIGLRSASRAREVQAALEKALAIRRKVLGEEHPGTAFGYYRLATQLYREGKYAEAAEDFQKALAICRKVLGEEHPDTANTYNQLALNLDAQGKHTEAAERFHKALAIRSKVLGEEHSDTAQSYNNLALNAQARGKYEEAVEGYQKALAIYRKVLGEEHPYTALGYSNLAGTLNLQGKYTEAEETSRKALTICRKVLGEEHYYTAASYNHLSQSLNAQGKYAEAAEGSRKALNIKLRVFGEEHPNTATDYHNLACNLQAQGKYAEAAEGCRKALEIYREMLGEEHPLTATGYNALAVNLHDQGKYAEAAEVHGRALAIRRRVLGEKHQDTAQSYFNLAANLGAQGKYAEAAEDHRKALEITLEVLGEEHPSTANSYYALAGSLEDQGKFVEADEGLRKALAVYRKVFGEEHPHTALGYSALAHNLYMQGKYAEAAEGFRKPLAILRKVFGEEHTKTAISYSNVAYNLNALGKYAEAEEFWLRAAASFASARLHLTRAGLERATVTSEHSPLPHLAAVLARNGKTAEAWRRYEESLARGTWDDLSARLRRLPAEQAQQAQLAARLERLDQLIDKATVKEETSQHKKTREELLGQRRKAQDELDAFTHRLEKTYGPAAGQVFDLSRIQAALPADTALVGWLDLAPAGPKAADQNGEHWVFLLRSRGEPVCVRLSGSGDGGAWTAEDTQLPADLRTALLQHRGSWQRLASRLRQQRLRPLEKHLAAVRHLIVLPSTALAGVPLELLAEDHTVSYGLSGTLHTHLKNLPKLTSVGLLAVGDPIFETAAEAAKPKALPPGGLLLTVVPPGSNAAQSRLRPNDVLLKYGDRPLATLKDLADGIAAAASGGDLTVEVWRDGKVLRHQVRPGKLGVVLATDPAPKALAERYRLDRLLSARGGDGWRQLPGTRVEVASLQRLFGDKPEPKLLFDSAASEQTFDELAASGELGKYRYVHLATHGEVDDSRPLRSAVILSRDRLPDPEKQLLAGKPVYDGRLTAEQMLRSWHLDSELVTLSACETALGKYEKGEGFVGFAQALLLCGSRSVCLSLWKVDDAATALLMQRFYANLLGKRDGLKAPLGKAAALREAKQWLRDLSRAEALHVAAEVSQGVQRGKGRRRQLLLPPVPEPLPAAKDDKPYAHPYYWAAFVLIGDPE